MKLSALPYLKGLNLHHMTTRPIHFFSSLGSLCVDLSILHDWRFHYSFEILKQGFPSSLLLLCFQFCYFIILFCLQVNRKLATEVLQVTFLGNSGFRFPLAHFATRPILPHELHIIIWEIVSKLQDWGFHVDGILQDGGKNNRSFMLVHFQGNPRMEQFVSVNITNYSKIVQSQDFSHCMKKLRNSILASGLEGKRKLMYNGEPIIWRQWTDAVHWDRNINSRLIHFRVTQEHLYPNSSQKMRNHLAEEMLNNEMLYLMKCYRDYLNNSTVLEPAITLLEKTSSLIEIFRDTRPITSPSDERLQNIKKIAKWFSDWEEQINYKEELSLSEKRNCLPTQECLDDLQALLIGFYKICEHRLEAFPGWGVVPSRYNTDIIENHFCQIRGIYNGNNCNPTLAAYSNLVNTVALGQTAKSKGRKSNCGIPSIDPYQFYLPKNSKRVKTE